MTHSGPEAVQNGEIDELELVPELILLDDLMEEPGDMCRRIGKRTAAHGRQHQRIVELRLADAEDGPDLIQGDVHLGLQKSWELVIHLDIGISLVKDLLILNLVF